MMIFNARVELSNFMCTLFISVCIAEFSSEMNDSKVDLGFLDKCEPWLLVNKFFPSKVGGLPAWLNLETIPSINKLKCKECNQSLMFLCQVRLNTPILFFRSCNNNKLLIIIFVQIYAPLDQYEHCFHRTLFVFICSDWNCWKPNVSR